MHPADAETQTPCRRFTSLAAVGVLLLAIGCEQKTPDPKPEAKVQNGPARVTLSAAAVASAGIKTEIAALRPVDEVLLLTGTLGYDENKVAHVAPRVGGSVARILVDFGESVGEGQTLAEIDSPELGQALADWRKANSVAAVRERDYERAKKLLEGKAISQGEFLSREGEYLTAKAELENADSRLHLLGLSHLESARLIQGEEVSSVFPLRSPLAGKVVDRLTNRGSVVEAGKELFTIGNLENLWLLVRLYEKDLGDVRVGQEVIVVTETYANDAFTGTIDYVGDQVDAVTRTVRARAVIANREGKLKPGMFVQAKLVTAAGGPVLTVPEVAVQEIDKVPTVFVEVEPNTFEARPIETGRLGRTLLEVRKGITANERVATAGSLTLKAEVLRSELGEGD